MMLKLRGAGSRGRLPTCRWLAAFHAGVRRLSTSLRWKRGIPLADVMNAAARHFDRKASYE